MKRHPRQMWTHRLVVFVVTLILNQAAIGQANLDIALKHGTSNEAQTRDQLQRLLATYDLSPWIYTKSIVIDERAIPFSHPVLTLHTRHLTDDELLLSTFVHEQFHWFLAERPEATEAGHRGFTNSVPACANRRTGRWPQRVFHVPALAGVLPRAVGCPADAGRVEGEAGHGLLGY